MYNYGHTRSARYSDHLLHTPDSFVRAPLPGMNRATAIVHAAPALGAGFTQYTAEFDAEGMLAPATAGLERFVYVLEGALSVGDLSLTDGDYAWVPPTDPRIFHAPAPARAAVIEKIYIPLEGKETPHFFSGNESRIAPVHLAGDPGLEVRGMIPAEAAFDLAINTMTFEPGATLPMVEIHLMEHGLLMLEGTGIYRLGDHWYPVQAGDFIWMAPYLPQWFGALGKVPAKYMIYKDWNR